MSRQWRRRLRRWWRLLGQALAERRTIVQVVALVLGAVLAGIAAVAYSNANGDWQQAIREESKRSGLVQEEVRSVYDDEAPLAFRIAAARVRSEALLSVRRTSRLAESEQVVAEQSAFALGQGVPPGALASGRDYADPIGGFDVPRRLADVVRTGPPLPDSDETFTEGDRQASVAHWISVTTVVVTGIAMVAASIRRRPSPRPRTNQLSKEAEVIPQPGVADHPARRITTVLLVLWAAGVLLPFAQLALGAEEQRFQAAAARTAVQVSGEIAVSLARTGFETNALRDAILADIGATAREIGALDTTGTDADDERAVAAAEGRAAVAIRDIASRMGRAPTEHEGPDPATVRALASTRSDWEAAGQVQAAQAHRSETFGSLSNFAVVLISVVAAASALVEVTAAHRRAPSPR